MRRSYSFVVGPIILLLSIQPATAEKRVASGNRERAPTNAPEPTETSNDASDVAAALARSGL